MASWRFSILSSSISLLLVIDLICGIVCIVHIKLLYSDTTGDDREHLNLLLCLDPATLQLSGLTVICVEKWTFESIFER